MPYRRTLPYRRVPWSGDPLYLENPNFHKESMDEVSQGALAPFGLPPKNEHEIYGERTTQQTQYHSC